MIDVVKVKDLDKNIFPNDFLHQLPLTCDICGADNEVMESLSYLQCSNPKCISKVGYRLFLLLKDLGINTLSVDECIEFLEEFDTLNPYSILLYNYDNDGELILGFGAEKSESFYNELNRKRGMLLWEFIKIGHFGNFNESIEKILRGYSNLHIFYDDLMAGGIPFVQSLLLKETTLEDTDSICVNAVLIYDLFISNREDILEGLDGVVILNPDYTLGVLFANSVDKNLYSSNKDFLYEVNGKLKNKIYLYPLYILNENVSLVYWEEEELGVKNSIVEKLEIEYPDIPIVNTENIYNELLGVLENGQR